MRLDDAAEVEFLEAARVEAGQEHVVDEEQVDFTRLEVLDLLLA